jgi:hypothetical protein
MEISKEILKQAGEMSASQLSDYQNYVDRAFQENNEILDINLKIKLSMNKEKFKIQTDISFISEKIKDSLTRWWDPNQRQLFEDEPEGD